MSKLPRSADPNLLVGFDHSDDACVYRLTEHLALVQTVDFFPPMVDAPYLFGQIAAANALSDIYVMGGIPRTAMNLLCYPACLSPETVEAILAGGLNKVQEAGAVLAGGHTIQDEEPKYGLCVTGVVDPARVLTNAGAKPGDLLLLTKPLGTGILTTAYKAELLSEQEFSPVAASMAALNRTAAEIVQKFPIHACTDITGFGLLGHAYEMAEGSGVSIRLFSQEVPRFEQAIPLAEMGLLPAGAYANAAYVEKQSDFSPQIPRALRDLLADPQTSGGLLFAVPHDQGKEICQRLQEKLPWTRMIGEVVDRQSYLLRVE